MKKLTWIMILLLGTVSNSICRDYFVSPQGSDKNKGTLEKPFKTLPKAMKEVRKFAGQEAVTVYLRGGVYTINETLIFGSEDGGIDGKPVVYTAYNDEKPIISGGEVIDEWEKEGNYIYKAPTNGKTFRQLYVNDKKAIRSRYPNGNEYLRIKKWNKENKTILMNSEDIKDWRNYKEVEIFVQMAWSIAIMRIDEFTPIPEADVLTVTNPEKDIVFKRQFPPRKSYQAYHFENAREFIDVPGEWSISRKEGVVYYYPLQGQDMTRAEVIIPTVETLLKIKGTLDNPVKYLEFKGITFKHSTWLRPTYKGYLNIQAGQYNVEPTVNNNQYVERPPAAVLVECGHNIRFERNVFTQLGAVALDLHYGTKHCEVAGNVFFDVSGTAISHAKLSDPGVEIHRPYHPEDERELCVNDKIHNNYITKCGFDYGGAIGILSGWPVGVQIDHNELKDLAYTGISVGWGWTHEPNAMRDNKIRWNLIDNPCSLYADGGGIYTLSNMPGSLIYRNYIRNVQQSEWAVGASTKCYYLDEGSGGITLQENHEQYVLNIERLRLHVPGEITVKPKTFDMYRGIIDGAGIEKEYQDIKNKIPEN